MAQTTTWPPNRRKPRSYDATSHIAAIATQESTSRALPRQGTDHFIGLHMTFHSRRAKSSMVVMAQAPAQFYWSVIIGSGPLNCYGALSPILGIAGWSPIFRDQSLEAPVGQGINNSHCLCFVIHGSGSCKTTIFLRTQIGIW